MVNYKNKYLKYKLKFEKIIKQKGGMEFNIDDIDDISDSVMDSQYSNLRKFREKNLSNQSSRPSSPRPSSPRPSSPRPSSPIQLSPKSSSPIQLSPKSSSPRQLSPRSSPKQLSPIVSNNDSLFLISSDDDNDVSPKPTRRINTILARPIQPSFNRNRRYKTNRTYRTEDSSDEGDMEREEMKKNWQPGTGIPASDVYNSVEEMVKYGKIRSVNDLEDLD